MLSEMKAKMEIVKVFADYGIEIDGQQANRVFDALLPIVANIGTIDHNKIERVAA